MKFLQNIFGDTKEREAQKLRPIVEQINTFEPSVESVSQDALLEQTNKLRQRLQNGTSLDELLPEAFALVRESAKRTLGQRHFDVQLMGGIVLHQGKIDEMKTGEGKTLTSTLAAYLNALPGQGVHIVTVNDYLTKRDAVWMGQIYYALGLNTACITHDASYIYDPTYYEEKAQGSQEDRERDIVGGFRVLESYLRPVSRKEAYAADITYGTNNEFGFDYLRDNMVYDAEQQVQRGHHFAIVDEIDSALIDEARTPLIISAPDHESSGWYREFAQLMPKLKKDTDFEVDEKLKAVTLTEPGIDKVEQLLGVKDIYEEKGIKYLHHLEQALRAHALFERDRDYVVRDGLIIIVDEFTGRLLPGRRYSGGLHQALEAKEGAQVQPESKTLASITFQNYFRMYEKLAGMTGTALTSAEEFYRVYGREVVVVPTNKPMIRQDLADRVYKTEEAKFLAVAREVKERHEKGQPVLIGTVSIAKNEYLGKLLEREGVKHEILNAKNHEREAEIIAQAGKPGAVTVATNMAGRGVDIILGGNPPDDAETEKIKEVGGLHVIGTERHEARRIDNQLRGRAGRQGDPGSTQFYVSLQDDLVRVFGGERISGLMERFHLPEDQPIESRLVSNAIESAQTKIEGMHFDARKRLLEFDDVLNRHREAVYKKRKEILLLDSNDLKRSLVELAQQQEHTAEEYEQKEQELGEEQMRQAERIVPLRIIDTLWVEHLEQMEELRDSVRLRAYGQQDPLTEYRNEGHRLFRELLDTIDKMTIESLLKVQVAPKEQQAHPPHLVGGQASPFAPVMQGNSSATSSSSAYFQSPKAQQPQWQKSPHQVGRNDPCPCGSGLKYKRCGLISAPQHKR